MSETPLERDPAIAALLGEAADEPPFDADALERVRRGVGVAAAAELARRRAVSLTDELRVVGRTDAARVAARPGRRWQLLLGSGTLAAALALLFVVGTLTRGGGADGGWTVGADAPTVDDILDADVSDAQFRALLAGAAFADELLRIAAGENGTGQTQ
jgi:hypothetical protein